MIIETKKGDSIQSRQERLFKSVLLIGSSSKRKKTMMYAISWECLGSQNYYTITAAHMCQFVFHFYSSSFLCFVCHTADHLNCALTDESIY